MGFQKAYLLLLLLFFVAHTASAYVRDDIENKWLKFNFDSVKAMTGNQFPHAACFRKAARKYHLPEALLLAVARGESNFDATAKSSANAYGVMQILWPTTANHLGISSLNKLLDPCTNIDAGARYLLELSHRYQGNLHKTLAAYNYGPSRISINGSYIPDGARWYSGYIYRHLTFIEKQLNKRVINNDSSTNDYYQLLVIQFDRPYRASALVENLSKQLVNYQFDWFRRPQGHFEVVVLYKDDKEKQSALKSLSRLGFVQAR